MAIENLVFRDTIPFNFNEYDKGNQLNAGSIKVLASNHYPCAANVKIFIAENNWYISDSLLTSEPLASAAVSASGKVIEAKESQVEISIKEPTINALRAAKYLILEVQLNTPAYPSLVEFNSRDYIDIDLIGDFNAWRR